MWQGSYTEAWEYRLMYEVIANRREFVVRLGSFYGSVERIDNPRARGLYRWTSSRGVRKFIAFLRVGGVHFQIGRV